MNMKTEQIRIVKSACRVGPADASGLSLYVRHTRPEDMPKGTVVLIHGATLASGLWDIAVPGYSLMDVLARAGYSTWAPDIRGYARSDRLDQPLEPYAGREDAVRDIASVVAHACASDKVGQVLLAGGSWGSITASLYATRHPESVCALALMAPIYASVNLSWLSDLADPIERTRRRTPRNPVRLVDEIQIRKRWNDEVLHGDPDLRRDPAVLQALISDSLEAETQASGAFTVPNGTLDDLFDTFSGRPLYDPSLLSMPVLLVRGEHDTTSTDDDVRRLFASLGSRQKSYLQIGETGHFLCAERNAPLFHSALLAFSDVTFSSPQSEIALLPSP
ncbi:MAG: hypothetical protein CVU36_24045 [Betaproteobacteria bacterium HGW-Betaproteobacteria-9]|nr:MAG: hypothetical protein CVU36_24045 [Betaproteobacteria bacterium HGW-Betaproteobacteria-9]